MSIDEINLAFAEALGWQSCGLRGGIASGIPPNGKGQFQLIENYTDSYDKLVKLQDKLIVSDTQKLNFTTSVVEMIIKEKITRVGNYYYKILTLSKLERCEAILYAIGRHQLSPKD